MNCFHYTYLLLKRKGFNIPSEWGGFTFEFESKKIEDDPEYYLKNGIHEQYVSSFCKEVKKAQKK